MRLSSRVKKLAAAVPTCDGEILRFVRGEEPLAEADRCRICGACHVLVVREIIVQTREDVERVRVVISGEKGSAFLSEKGNTWLG